MTYKNISRTIVTLEEVASLYDSLHKTPVYVDSGYRMIRVTDIHRGYVNLEGAKYVDEKTFHEFTKKYTPNIGDTIFTRVGSYGNSCFVNRSLLFCLGQNTVCLKPHKEEVDAFYLYCCLNSPKIHDQISSLVGGASQPTISLGNIRSLSIPLPPLPTQKKIAAILSAYDDLIENNTRRIKILEEMAQAIYREWFVEFRFPGHEDVEMVEGPDGRMIPEGWDCKPIGKIIKKDIGGGWGKEDRETKYTEPAYVIRGTNIPEVNSLKIDGCPLRFHTESNIKNRKLEEFDIIMEVSGGGKNFGVGRVALITGYLLNSFDNDVICASFCKRMQVKNDEYPSLLLFLNLLDLYERKKLERYQVQSTGIKNFKFKVFLEEEEIIIPPKKLIETFLQAVCPIFDLSQILYLKNQVSIKSRDLLLPRLIEGEIDVS